MFGPTEAMRQASTTIDTYMRRAIKSIDKHFGEGYAAEHPELVGSFVQACTVDFDTAIRHIDAEELTSAISSIGSSIDDAVLNVSNQ